MKQLLTIISCFVVRSMSAQVPGYVPQEDLVAWYSLDGDAIDQGLQGLNGEIFGATPGTNRFGDENGAMSFNEAGDRIELGEISTSIGQANIGMTVSCWSKGQALPNDGNPSGGQIFSAYYGSGNRQIRLEVIFDPAPAVQNRLKYYWRCPSENDEPSSDFSLDTEQWHHYAWVVDPLEGEIRVYFNGQEVLSMAASYDSSQDYYGGEERNWMIGSYWPWLNQFPHQFQGSIDDLGIWTRPLSVQELNDLFLSEQAVWGCTDPSSCNYNEAATTDDDSCYPCEIPIAHCGPGTYWDPETLFCLPIQSCQEDLDGDGVIGINDLMELLSSFGTMCEEPETVEFTCGDPMNYHGYDYATVQIGEQCWFAENLRSELYQNGDAIAGQLTVADWTTTEEGASAVYGESDDCVNHSPLIDACDSAQALIEYGRLYNGYAVIDSRGLCPVDWSIPNNSSWQSLITLAGGASVAGGFLKAETGWSGSGSGINSFGFAGKPGGDRNINGDFVESGHDGDWWTSSSNGTSVLVWEMYHLNSSINQLNGPLASGFSVRCLKD